MRRTICLAAALFVAVAPLTSVGLAQRPDDRAGMIGVGHVMAPEVALERASARPDDQPGPRGPGALAPRPTRILVSADGFDWGDAGVGLAGGLGLALATAGLAVAATHRRRLQSLA